MPAVFFWLIVYLVSISALSAGAVVALLLYIGRFFAGAKLMSSAYQQLAPVKTSLPFITILFNSEDWQRSGSTIFEEKVDFVDFKSVAIQRGDAVIVSGVSLRINPGMTIIA